MFSTIIKNRTKIYTFTIFFVISLFAVFPYSNFDWGWRYRYGEYFFQHWSVLKDNIYTWTLPQYQFINTSWLFDPIVYLLTIFGGFAIFSFLSGLLTSLTLFIILIPYRLSYWKIGIIGVFFLLLTQVGIIAGLGSQVISLLFLAIEISLIETSKKKKKILIFLIPLLLIWANMHLDFIFGLIIAGIFFLTDTMIKFLTTKQINQSIGMWKVCILLLCFLVTLLNPFGYEIYIQPFAHIFSSNIKMVAEWQPIYENCGPCNMYIFFPYSIFILFTIILVIRKRNWDFLPYAIITLLLFWPTATTRRFLPIFTVVTIPLFAYALNFKKWDPERYKATKYFAACCIVITILFNLFNRFTSFHLYHFTDSDYCNFGSGCSPEMTSYLLANPPKGKGFNDYNIGGYLIGKGIPTKLFIDGRMPEWEENNYAPIVDYYAIYYENKLDLFKKYNFDWVLIEKSNLVKKLNNTNDLGIWQLRAVTPTVYGEQYYFVRLHDNNILFFKQKARNFIITKEYTLCQQTISQGIQKYPSSPSLWIDLSICNAKVHNWNDAQVAALKAQTIDPNDFTNHFYEGIKQKIAIPDNEVKNIVDYLMTKEII